MRNVKDFKVSLNEMGNSAHRVYQAHGQYSILFLILLHVRLLFDQPPLPFKRREVEGSDISKDSGELPELLIFQEIQHCYQATNLH